MDNKNNILKELEEIAPAVANLDKHHIYSVPDGYFDFLVNEIIDRIKFAQISSSANPYEVPMGYFEQLAGSIMEKISSQRPENRNNEVSNELGEIAPLLNAITKENVFSVPDGYFEKLRMPVAEKTSGRVIRVDRNIRKWVTYAVAASILLIIATASYLYVNSHYSPGITRGLSIEQRLANLNDDELINYLKDNQEIISGDLIHTPDEQDREIQHLLKNTSDEELQRYLDDYSDASENNAKGI